MKHPCPSRSRTRRHTLLRFACPSLVAALLVSGSCVRAAVPAGTLTWDPSMTGTGSYGSGTWDAGTTADWSSGTTDTTFVTGDTAIFDNTSTGMATVTLGSAVSALNMELLSTGYTITPSATNILTLTAINGTGGTTANAIYAASGITTSIGGTINFAGSTAGSTTQYISAASGATINLTGALTQGNIGTSGVTMYGPGAINSTAAIAPGKFNVQGGATFTSSANITLTTNGTYTGVSDTVTGTTWDITGGIVGGTPTGTPTAVTTLFVGNGAGTSGTLAMTGGSAAIFNGLNVGNTYNGTAAGDSTGTVSLTNSTLTINGAIHLGSTFSGVGTLNLNTGGRMLITSTAGAITRGTGSTGTGGSGNINFNGGTIQYNAAPASNPAIAANIAMTILDNGATINTNSFNVTIASTIAHGGTAATDGGLTKINGGILTLTAANTYTGATTINAGTLAISTNGGLSTGNVTVAAGATLSLGTGVTAAHSNLTSGLTLSTNTSAVALTATTAGTVQDTVGTLVVAGTTETAAGTYGGTGSGANTILTEFTGNGVIMLTPVPEPSAWALMLGGLGGLALVARLRRNA